MSTSASIWPNSCKFLKFKQPLQAKVKYAHHKFVFVAIKFPNFGKCNENNNNKNIGESRGGIQ